MPLPPHKYPSSPERGFIALLSAPITEVVIPEGASPSQGTSKTWNQKDRASSGPHQPVVLHNRTDNLLPRAVMRSESHEYSSIMKGRSAVQSVSSGNLTFCLNMVTFDHSSESEAKHGSILIIVYFQLVI